MFLSLLSPSGTTGVFQRTLRGIVVASTATLVADKFAALDTTLASLSAQATARLTSFADGGNQTLDAASVVARATPFANATTTAVLAPCQATSSATLTSFVAGAAQLDPCSLVANDTPPVPFAPDARRTFRVPHSARQHAIASRARKVRQHALNRRHYASKE